jgi:hypothetical protein
MNGIIQNPIEGHLLTWVWVNTYRYIFSGMNIHLPAILGFTTRVLTHPHMVKNRPQVVPQ